MTINGASTTIAGEAKPGPTYLYDNEHIWTVSRTNLPGGMEFNSVFCIWGGQSIANTMDLDATSVVGSDGHTYLRGELKETNDQSYTRTHKYAIARQV